MLIGLPVLLGLVWWSGEHRGASATADVTIDTAKVVELRGLVISRLATVGATKTAEDTAYADGGASELTFRVPASRLEEALVELNLVGGIVTRQRVELDELDADADAVAAGITEADGCLTDLSERLASGTANGAAVEVDRCREHIDAAAEQVASSPQASRDAVLNVHITKTSTSSPALIIAVVLLAVALAMMAYLTIRSTRSDRVYDVTDSRPSRPSEDLYHRRN